MSEDVGDHAGGDAHSFTLRECGNDCFLLLGPQEVALGEVRRSGEAWVVVGARMLGAHRHRFAGRTPEEAAAKFGRWGGWDVPGAGV